MKLARRIVLLGALAVPAASAEGCAAFQKQDPAVIASEVQLACALENAILGDATIRKVCGIAEDVWPAFAPYLAATRKGIVRERASMKAAKCEQ